MTSPGELGEREQLILQAVVHTYITTAEAVGSRSIVKRYELELSPATVRNVMADLEDSGYLQQLHASSGRVPTDLGYRYYVDYLMRVQELTLAERARIEQQLAEKLSDTDEVMRQTSQLLALVSHQTGIVEAPDESAAVVRRAELMPVSGSRVAIMIADQYGRVRTVFAAVEGALEQAELMRLSTFLNENFVGTPIEELAHRVESKLRTILDEQRMLAEKALQMLLLMPPHRQGQLYLGGQTQLFEQPEFRDVAKAREVFGLLEERERLAELLRAGLSGGRRDGVTVVIGGEADERGLEGISVVSAPYRVGEETVGMLGVLGPRRMPYSRLMAVVDYTASALSRFLTRLSG